MTTLSPRPAESIDDYRLRMSLTLRWGTTPIRALTKLLPGQAVQGAVDIWFQDEARMGQTGTHGYVWAEAGSCPLTVRDHRPDSAYIFGAICPARGVGAAMITPSATTEGMNLHLAEIGTRVAADA